MTVEVDFASDWASQKAEELKKLGFNFRAGDPHGIAMAYFNTALRVIPPKPRRLLLSNEFKCPPDRAPGLATFVAKVAHGGDLNPHMTKDIEGAEYHDGLFNDWGIHHFHLGLQRYAKKPYFVERTGPLLFAIVTDEAVHCIDVLRHKDDNGNPIWGCRRLLQIVHDNWPHLIQRWRMNVEDVEPSMSDSTYYQMRRRGFSCLIPLKDGTVYCSPGGGYAQAGNSFRALMMADQCMNFMRRMTAHVRERESRLRDALHARGVEAPDHMKIRLVEKAKDFWGVVDGPTTVEFWLADKPS